VDACSKTAVKAKATKRALEVIGADVVFASNPSMLPLTSLAKTSLCSDDFVGIYFFSPVEKMLLVEIIRGKETDDAALATTLDFVRLLKKTPIVVNDSRGFFANRRVRAELCARGVLHAARRRAAGAHRKFGAHGGHAGGAARPQ
jgi:3-hydroxyacyl-CoA dehydrogenase